MKVPTSKDKPPRAAGAEIAFLYRRVFDRAPALFALTVILTTYLFFGLQHIGQFITADEHYWVEERIPKYWNAWAEGKWRNTLINDKPGVSLALVSGPALLLHESTSLDCEEKTGWYRNCDPKDSSALYASFRVPILLMNALLLILIFFSIRAFSGFFVAALATGLIAISPHLLGMSQIVNPDSLLWSAGSGAIFSFLAFLKTAKRPFAYFAIATLTLALLSKYTALILVFFLPVILLLIRTYEPFFSPLSPGEKVRWLLRISFLPFFIFAILAPGAFSSLKRITDFFTAGTGSFLPWAGYLSVLVLVISVHYFKISEKISAWVGKVIRILFPALGCVFLLLVFSLVFGRFLFPAWDIFTIIPFDIKDLSDAKYYPTPFPNALDIAFLELSPLVYGLPLLTLFFAILAIGRASTAKPRTGSFLPLILFIFVILYVIAMALSNVLAIPRYILLLYPVFSLLAALGIKDAWASLPSNWRRRPHATILIVLLIALSLGSLISSKPYYGNFANSLLPEDALIAHSWGYGGYEAAEYLNSLPDAKNLTVWSDYYGVCEFFVGRCLTAYTLDRSLSIDYYVLTYRGGKRYIPRSGRWEKKSGLKAYQYYDRNDPVWALDINGQEKNFIKIMKTAP